MEGWGTVRDAPRERTQMRLESSLQAGLQQVRDFILWLDKETVGRGDRIKRLKENGEHLKQPRQGS